MTKKKSIRYSKAFLSWAEWLFEATKLMDNWLRNQCQRSIVDEYLECERNIQ